MKKKYSNFDEFMGDFRNHEYKIVVMCGLPGSGKSYWAEKIAEAIEAVILTSDEIRKELFGSVRLSLVGDKVVSEQSRQAYEIMYGRTIEMVKDGGKVVLDATHLKSGRKKILQRLLTACDDVVVVVVKTPHDVTENRMKKVSGMSNEKENFYEGWKRVAGYFEQGFARGEYSWPEDGEGGAVVVEVNNE